MKNVYVLALSLDDCVDDDILEAANAMNEFRVAMFDDSRLFHVPEDHPALVAIRPRLPHENMMEDYKHT